MSYYQELIEKKNTAEKNYNDAILSCDTYDIELKGHLNQVMEDMYGVVGGVDSIVFNQKWWRDSWSLEFRVKEGGMFNIYYSTRNGGIEVDFPKMSTISTEEEINLIAGLSLDYSKRKGVFSLVEGWFKTKKELDDTKRELSTKYDSAKNMFDAYQHLNKMSLFFEVAKSGDVIGEGNNYYAIRKITEKCVYYTESEYGEITSRRKSKNDFWNLVSNKVVLDEVTE